MALIKYSVSFIQYSQANQISSNCNSITFLNLGTATAYIEGVPIITGASIAIDGNECEYTDDIFNLSFDTTGTTNLVVIKKTYTNVN
jgi:hypothetical protein